MAVGLFQSAKARLLLCDVLVFLVLLSVVAFQSAKARLLLCDLAIICLQRLSGFVSIR